MQFAIPPLAFPVRSIRSLVLVFVVFYLAFHAISGERGVLAWLKASRDLEVLKLELAKTREAEQQMSQKVALLNQKSVDFDMLDEQARRILGFARPDEVVILRQQEHAK